MISFDEASPNQLLLNPRLTADEKAILLELQREFESSFGNSGYFLIASSGSSQRAGQSSKLMALSVKSVLNSARRFNSWFAAGAADTWALLLPDFHVAGLGVRARAFLAGAEVLPALEDRVAFVSLVPAQVHDLVTAGARAPAALKKVFVGAGALNSGLRASFAELGWPVVETYGMTETASMIAVREEAGAFTVLPGVEVKLQGDLLALRCDSLLTAVLQKDEDEIQFEVFSEGEWYQTQDLAEVESSAANVLLNFKGRSGDYVKILGEGVSLSELRSQLQSLALLQQIKIADFELVAVPCDRAGHELVLVYEEHLGRGPIADLVKEFQFSARPYERIGRVLSVKRIPRTDLGKLKVEEIRSMINSYGQNQ